MPTAAPWRGWTTDPTDAPWDVTVGGETMTVTAADGGPVVDDFDRTAASGWGTATSGQAWTTSGGSSADYSVADGAGIHSVATLDTNRFTLITPPSNTADFSLAVSISTPVLATGTQGHQAYLIARHLDASNYFGARLELRPDQSVHLSLIRLVAGAPGTYPAVDTGLTHEADVPIRLRFEGQGATLRARAWLASEPEPTTWQTTHLDNSILTAGQVGIRTRSSPATPTPCPWTWPARTSTRPSS